MFKYLILLTLGCCLLTPARSARPRALPQAGDSGRYVCTNGRMLDVLYGGGVAVLTIGGATVEMMRDAAPGEESYSGGGWTWHVTAPHGGTLLRSGVSGSVACRAS